MYRQYEDPWALESRLAKLEAELDTCDDLDEAMYISQDIAELKERINFAWQDDEAEVEGYE